MMKTKSVRTIWAMSSGVIGDRPRKHESTKHRSNQFSCFRVFVASSVRPHRLSCAPIGRQGAPSFPDVRLVLVPEVLQRRQDRRDGGVAERAQGLAGDIAGDAVEQVEIAHLAFTSLDALENLEQPVRAFTARRAFAARL